MGEIDAAYANGNPDEFPIQRILALQVNDYDKWLDAYEKYNSKYNFWNNRIRENTNRIKKLVYYNE